MAAHPMKRPWKTALNSESLHIIRNLTETKVIFFILEKPFYSHSLNGWLRPLFERGAFLALWWKRIVGGPDDRSGDGRVNNSLGQRPEALPALRGSAAWMPTAAGRFMLLFDVGNRMQGAICPIFQPFSAGIALLEGHFSSLKPRE
jgi:hypothetical protein